MKYTYEELKIMLEETEKALDVERKFSETYQKFIYENEERKEEFKKFLIQHI